MKTPETRNPDDPLSRLLKQWDVKAPLPLGFEAGVFRRIEKSQQPSLPRFWLKLEFWIASAFARPAVATFIFAGFLSVGLTAGWIGGQQESARTKAELSERYLRSVSPVPSAHGEMK